MLLPLQGATAPTRGNPGCRYACPGLWATLAFQAALANTNLLYHSKQQGCVLWLWYNISIYCCPVNPF